jgi:hypothetical protein
MSASLDPKAMFAFFQQMMNPAATTLNTLFVGLTDPKEVDKKIADLQAVKLWLTASVATVEMSIQALEFQRSLLGGNKEGEAAPSTSATPTEWAMDLMQRAAASGIKATEDAIQAVRPKASQAATPAKPKPQAKPKASRAGARRTKSE